jgi:hypothetical protein
MENTCEFSTKLFKYEKGKGFSGLCCSFTFPFVALVSQLSFHRRKQDRKKEKKEETENTLFYQLNIGASDISSF